MKHKTIRPCPYAAVSLNSEGKPLYIKCPTCPGSAVSEWGGYCCDRCGWVVAPTAIPAERVG